jgi:hypothetical protein
MIEHVRRGMDGSYWIPRRHAETEAYLDSQFERIDTLRWMPKNVALITHYQGIYKDQICNIIGKGPSLDNLTLAMLMKFDGPILCLNESIHKVLTLKPSESRVYVIQMDSTLGETCNPGTDQIPIFLSPRCANLYQQGCNPVVIDPYQFALDSNCLSGQFAIKLARTFGCVGACLFSFDGCLRQNYGYANCIGYPSSKGGIPTRFREHKQMLLQTAGKNFPLQWIIPREGGVYDHTMPLA